ncbi:hypothetical protein [Bartonella jaculi]|uniref:hypothetical protein n=1 Tax=Bartonella jaculi TaxID=686226 RepID=UPI0031E734F6
MKWKNSAFFNKRPSFFEKELFSTRELVVICCLSLVIALWDKILSLPSLAEWELTVEQDSMLLSVSVLWQVITVCACVLIPIMAIVYIILWYLLGINTQKLKEINQQQGKITFHQKDRYKKSDRGKKYDILVAIFVLVLVLVTAWIAVIPMMILPLYYGVFKQVRMYRCLRKQLKSVLKEPDTAV